MLKFAIAASMSLCAGAFAQVTTQAIGPATDARPLQAMQSPGDQTTRLFLVEQRLGSLQTGRIRIFKNGAFNATPFLQVSPVSTADEQGLLGMAFHPNYATNGKFYINYTGTGGTTFIDEYTVSANPDVADAASRRQILSYAQPFDNHNGGWIDFGPDGYLYISSGDGGSGNDPGNRAQTINNAGATQFLGKLLRLDVNGDDFPADPAKNYRIPPTNTFGVAGNPGAEIWAYGLRNPWRPSFDKLTGDLWIADVGQDQFEEVNFQPAGAAGGRNYGWRCMEGFNCTGLSGCTCNAASLTLPLFQYRHSGTAIPPTNANGCSITGGFVYRGCAIPSIAGLYIFGDYCTGRIFAYNRTTNTATQLLQMGLGLTSFGEDNDGELYFCMRGSGSNGSLLKLVPTTAITDCNGNGRADCSDIASGRSVDTNGDNIPDECQCLADFNGDTEVDFFDYLDFVDAFSSNLPTADFNGDGSIDFFDYLDFVDAFSEGCV